MIENVEDKGNDTVEIIDNLIEVVSDHLAHYRKMLS